MFIKSQTKPKPENEPTGLISVVKPNGSLAAITDDDLGFVGFREPKKQYSCPVDVLHVVVALSHKNRTADKPYTPYISEYLETSLLVEITDAHRAEAAAIRSYYGHKVVMDVLTEKDETHYRRSLREFLATDGTKFTQDVFGLVCTLPEFYEHDMIFESIKPQFTPLKARKPDRHPGTVHGHIARVELIQKMARRRNKTIDYWLRECSTGAPVLLPLKALNPLEHLLDREFKRSNNQVELTFGSRYSQRDDFGFHSIRTFQIL